MSWRESARANVLACVSALRSGVLARRCEIASIKDALGFIDRDLPSELKRLPRWTFAHALLLVAARTGKSRDLKATVRQLRQALGNEKWLEEAEDAKNS